MKETDTVTISDRTWTSNPGSPQGPGSDHSDGPPSAARGADAPDSGVRRRAGDSAWGAEWGSIRAAVLFLAEPAAQRCPRRVADRPRRQQSAGQAGGRRDEHRRPEARAEVHWIQIR